MTYKYFFIFQECVLELDYYPSCLSDYSTLLSLVITKDDMHYHVYLGAFFIK